MLQKEHEAAAAFINHSPRSVGGIQVKPFGIFRPDRANFPSRRFDKHVDQIPDSPLSPFDHLWDRNPLFKNGDVPFLTTGQDPFVEIIWMWNSRADLDGNARKKSRPYKSVNFSLNFPVVWKSILARFPRPRARNSPF